MGFRAGEGTAESGKVEELSRNSEYDSSSRKLTANVFRRNIPEVFLSC
jgi:hypothetical protein